MHTYPTPFKSQPRSLGTKAYPTLVNAHTHTRAHMHTNTHTHVHTHTGENKYSEQVGPKNGLPYYAIGMPGKDRTITFTQPCPAVVWSGGLLSSNYFSVLHPDVVSKSRQGKDVISVSAVIRRDDLTQEDADGGRKVRQVYLDYRMVLADGFRSQWASNTARKPLAETESDQFAISQGWKITPSFPDGVYEIRAVAECSEFASDDPFDRSETPAVQGVIDRKKPELLAFVSSSLGDSPTAGDYFVLTYSEDVICSGVLVDGNTRVTVKLELTSGTSKWAAKSGQLLYSCDGAEITFSIEPGATQLLQGRGAVEVTVGGVYDAAGNPASETTRKLMQGQAAKEQANLKAELTEVNSKLDLLLASDSAATARL